MKDQVKTPVIVVLAVLVVGLVIFFAMKVFNAGNLDQGQVKYTPGTPPWLEKDPNKRGPGTGPAASQSGGAVQPGQPGQPPAGMTGQQGMPVGPPAISNK